MICLIELIKGHYNLLSVIYLVLIQFPDLIYEPSGSKLSDPPYLRYLPGCN